MTDPIDTAQLRELLTRYSDVMGLTRDGAIRRLLVLHDYAHDAADELDPLRAELERGKGELRRLMVSIWKMEYRLSAPNWQPLPDLVGMVTQIDNMYAGVRNERDHLRAELAGEKKAHGRTVELLRSMIQGCIGAPVGAGDGGTYAVRTPPEGMLQAASDYLASMKGQTDDE